MTARILELPLTGSYHTELAAYARLRSGDGALELAVQAALGAFYGACDVVLSPSAASDARLGELGVAAERIGRFDRGVDVERFDPARREPGPLRRAARPRARALRRAPDDREGRRPARRRVPRRAGARPAAAPAAGRRRPRGGRGCASASATPRRSSAGSTARSSRPTYASADVLLFCSADRHVRPGAARGAGVRPAGRRGPRRRPGRADRVRALRAAVPARRRGDRRGRRRPGRRPGGARAARPRRARRGPATARGTPRSAGWATAGGGASRRPRRALPAGPPDRPTAASSAARPAR